MSGCAPFLCGASYESRVARCLARLTWAATGDRVVIARHPAGASHANDLQFYAPDAPDAPDAPPDAPAPEARIIGLEIKTCGAVEAGQRTFRLTSDRDPRRRRLVIPDNAQNQIHRYCLPPDFRPFKGRVPSFLLGDRSLKTWRAEKRHFRSEYLAIAETDVIARYYQRKGSDYIQIQNLGLFHTGRDPCGFGVPLFACAIRMRIRCKQHGSASVPSSVLAALQIVDRASLAPSPYCLESRPPPPLRAPRGDRFGAALERAIAAELLKLPPTTPPATEGAAGDPPTAATATAETSATAEATPPPPSPSGDRAPSPVPPSTG